MWAPPFPLTLFFLRLGFVLGIKTLPSPYAWEARARERRMAREHGSTVAEVAIRKLVLERKLGEAIAAWAGLGAPLELCEFLLEQCRLTQQFPEATDLTALLDVLHASEEPPEVAVQGSAPIGDSVSLWVQHKTTIYNSLICVANSVSTLETVFKILEEMETRGIEKDVATIDGVMWAIHTKQPHEDVNNLYYSGGTSY